MDNGAKSRLKAKDESAFLLKPQIIKYKILPEPSTLKETETEKQDKDFPIVSQLLPLTALRINLSKSSPFSFALFFLARF